MHGRISAVIVTYNPNHDVIDNVKSIAKQVGEVVIIDNGSHNKHLWVDQILEVNHNVNIVTFQKNMGIAHALNVGITLLAANSVWIATFDQDTLIESGYFHEIFRQIEAYKQETVNIGLIAPNFTGLSGAHAYEDLGVRDLSTAITSGSVINLSVAAKTGLFDDLLFIDYVDNDFCLRINALGYKVIEVTGVKLNHNLGSMSPHKLCGMKFHTTNHNSVRRYYIFRNRIHLYRRYGALYPTWFARDVARNFTEVIKILLWEDKKISKVLHAALGLYDGLLNKFGEVTNRKLKGGTND